MGAPGAELGHPGFEGGGRLLAGAEGLVLPIFLAWLGVSFPKASDSEKSAIISLEDGLLSKERRRVAARISPAMGTS